jgi:hypothetical protein
MLPTLSRDHRQLCKSFIQAGLLICTYAAVPSCGGSGDAWWHLEQSAIRFCAHRPPSDRVALMRCT